MTRRYVSRADALRRALTATFEIYALIDPRDLRIHYVGRSKGSRHKRLKAHLGAAWSAPGAAGAWLRDLYDARLFPVVTLLQVARGAPAAVAAERHWFTEGRRLGWPLKNKSTPSGSGLGLGRKDFGRQWTLADLGLDPGQPWMRDAQTRAALRRFRSASP